MAAREQNHDKLMSLVARKVGDKEVLSSTALHAKHTGGLPPLGYDVDEEGYYVINEQEAVIVKKFFLFF